MLRLFAAVLAVFVFSIEGQSCPTGFTYNSNINKCYKYVSQPKSWLAALEYCQSLGGNLVEVQNSFENTYVDSLVTNKKFYSWIGLNYLMDSDWMWSTGQPRAYANFPGGVPTGPSPYECAAQQASTAQWARLQCSSTLTFVCQALPGAQTPSCGSGEQCSGTPVGQCGSGNAMSIGPCISGQAGPCGSGNYMIPGYACDSTLNYCCPVVNTSDRSFQVGPAVGGMCPIGYTVVYGLAGDVTGDGVCVELGSVAGVCAANLQRGTCNYYNPACPSGYCCNVYGNVCCPS